MLKGVDYTETRAVKIKEAQAIFSQTIINRLLRAKIRGREERICFETLGDVIDWAKKGKLDDVVSLTMRQRAEIMDYLDEIGVFEYSNRKKNVNVVTLN